MRFRAGDQWWMTDDLEHLAAEHQEAHRQEDPWESRVREFIAGRPGKPICQALILDKLLSNEAAKEDPKQAARVARIIQILVREGWKREYKKRRAEGFNGFWYQPPTVVVDTKESPASADPVEAPNMDEQERIRWENGDDEP